MNRFFSGLVMMFALASPAAAVDFSVLTGNSNSDLAAAVRWDLEGLSNNGTGVACNVNIDSLAAGGGWEPVSIDSAPLTRLLNLYSAAGGHLTVADFYLVHSCLESALNDSRDAGTGMLSKYAPSFEAFAYDALAAR